MLSQKVTVGSKTATSIEISPPVALAPMVGLSHSAIRSVLAEEGGIGLFYTEMLAARRLPHENPMVSPLLFRTEGESPLFYQLLTANAEDIGPAIEKLHKLGAQGVDLNLGCCAPLVKRQGAGAALAGNRRGLLDILRVMRSCTDLPLSVKIRLGDREDSSALQEFCRLLEGEGVDLITIHARLTDEKFCRRPRFYLVAEAKEAVSIPVFANGGIFSVEDAEKCLAQSGADGLMLGRGAVERPWLCADIAEQIYGCERGAPARSSGDYFFKVLELIEQRFRPERRLGRIKQFAQYYAGSMPFGHHLHTAVQKSNSIDEVRAVAENFFGDAVGDSCVHL